MNLENIKSYLMEQEKNILKVIVQLFTFYFFCIESRQLFLAGPGKYFSSGWNYLDIIPLVFIMMSM